MGAGGSTGLRADDVDVTMHTIKTGMRKMPWNVLLKIFSYGYISVGQANIFQLYKIALDFQPEQVGSFDFNNFFKGTFQHKILNHYILFF